MLSKPKYVVGDDRANEVAVRKLVAAARARASAAYSAGNFAEAAEIYGRIALEYLAAGLERAADTFQRRAREVLDRQRERNGDR
jgi:hypothetical protein